MSEAEREFELESEMERDLEAEREAELDREEELPWAPAGNTSEHEPTDLSELSDVACPFCGYLPRTAPGAGKHLLAHLVGRHTTGEAQLEAMRDA